VSDADISECGKYRYVLRRSLGSVLRWYKPALFIMLNPSTADAEVDDPTIRRCMNLAKREGMTHLNVVNLFALRATDPKQLRKADDPWGPLNSSYLHDEITKHRNSLIVCAWGADPFAKHSSATFLNLFSESFGLTCLGRTKSGAPRHPLYVRADQPLEIYP
jgi:hypothetical protein